MSQRYQTMVKIELLVEDVLRQLFLPILHAFWPLKSHKFGDDIQGTVSNTNMSNLLKMNKEDMCLRSHCCLHQYQDNDISTQYTTPPIYQWKLAGRWNSNWSLCFTTNAPWHTIVIKVHANETIAVYFFSGGSYFKIDQIMSGVSLTTRNWTTNPKK